MHDLRHGETGSIPLALLAVIIVTGLVVVVTSTVVTGERQTRFDEDYERALQVAEVGVERFAVALATDPDGVDSVLSGPGYEAELVTGEAGLVVESTGESGGVERTIQVDVGLTSLFDSGFVADEHLEIAGAPSTGAGDGVGVWSEEHGHEPRADGVLGTNGTVRLNGNEKELGEVVVYDYDHSDPDAESRCGGGSCQTDVYQTVSHPLDFSAAMEEIAEKFSTDDCASFGDEAWGPGNTLLPGTYCAHSRVDLPADVTVAGNEGVVEVLLMSSGENRLRSAVPKGEAGRLQFYSVLDSATQEIVVPSGNSDFRGTVFAPFAQCSVGPGNVTVYGAMVCRTLETGGNFTLMYVDDVAGITLGERDFDNWREVP